MKKLMFTLVTTAALFAYAEGQEPRPTEAEKERWWSLGGLQQLEQKYLWGFGNFGFYSGYQLYGSILNKDPVLQGYVELNLNLPWEVGPLDDLGYIGGGYWFNCDLTGRRSHEYRRAFNENDPNVHWAKTFWFDDDKTWGLAYRTAVIWYTYPLTSGDRYAVNRYTMDWDHYFDLINPYVIPYVGWVHEYRRSYGNLLQFGVKKPWQITDDFSLCPFIELVWRDRHYGWCFSNYGMDENYEMQSAGLATLKLELDATYMFCQYFGVWAKVAYCQNLDPHLRESADVAGESTYGEAYGPYNEFAWGGVGICVSF